MMAVACCSQWSTGGECQARQSWWWWSWWCRPSPWPPPREPCQCRAPQWSCQTEGRPSWCWTARDWERTAGWSRWRPGGCGGARPGGCWTWPAGWRGSRTGGGGQTSGRSWNQSCRECRDQEPRPPGLSDKLEPGERWNVTFRNIIWRSGDVPTNTLSMLEMVEKRDEELGTTHWRAQSCSDTSDISFQPFISFIWLMPGFLFSIQTEVSMPWCHHRNSVDSRAFIAISIVQVWSPYKIALIAF